jgi:hypothetical protein
MKAITKVENELQGLVDESEAKGNSSVTVRLDTLKRWLAGVKKPDARFREEGSARSKRKKATA